jgi:hypothetical protein
MVTLALMMNPENIEDTFMYCNTMIRRLERERERITRTGRLTAEQDLRLDEIDTEVEYWVELLDAVEYLNYEDEFES